MPEQPQQYEEAPEQPAQDEKGGGGGEEECEEGAPAWMVTFGDMMSLLMCFFVLLISFSTMDVVKYRSLVGSLRSAFGSQHAIVTRITSGREATVSLGESQPGKTSLTDDELENELVAAVETEGMTGQATLHRTDRGIVLRVRRDILFEPGTATLLPDAMPLLKKVALVCRYFTRKIYIEGHTDNFPIRSERYLSNWELSSARASSVVRYLTDVELLAPEKFVASGLAATVPIATNATDKGRATNRRVEFIFSGRPGFEDY